MISQLFSWQGCACRMESLGSCYPALSALDYGRCAAGTDGDYSSLLAWSSLGRTVACAPIGSAVERLGLLPVLDLVFDAAALVIVVFWTP